MPKKYRIGVLGLTHDHVWGHLPDVRAHERTELVAAADPHQELLGRVEGDFHCRPYTRYETMLDSEQLDAVYVFADNAACPELTELAAVRKLHVLVEKPMAASQSGAQRMLKATRAANVRLMVNWPFAWRPQLQHALHLAKSGQLGDLWQVKYRAAHEGPRELGCSSYFCEWLYDAARNGPGGAFTDYCCYGALLARVLLGNPASVSAVGGRLIKTDIDVGDNAILLMKYPHALAVSEGSWTQIGKLTAYTTAIYGTRGTLFIEAGNEGRLLWADAEHPEGREVAVPQPPTAMRTATNHFVACLDSGEPFCDVCHEQHGHDAQAILEAGARSLRSGALENVG
jgi:predicted dehydrogenase